MKKEKNKKLSVIVPVYNSEKYLKKCIESILSQSYDDFELILVNDGSTDKSGDICKKYKDSRIRYFEQDNRGVSCARNTGIKESCGEFITFADSDDTLSPDYLKMLVMVQKKYDTDITICTFSDVDEGGNNSDKYMPEWEKSKLIRGIRAKKELTDKILSNTGKRRPVMSPYCKLYRADIIKDNNIFFIENLPIGEDVLFNLEYARYIDSLLYLKKVLYFRTVREGSAVMSCRADIYKELKNLFKCYFKIKKRYKIEPRTEKLFFFNKLNDSLGLYIFRSSDIKELHSRIREMYRFIASEPTASVWKTIAITDLPDRRDRLKFILINTHMVSLWSLIKKYR